MDESCAFKALREAIMAGCNMYTNIELDRSMKGLEARSDDEAMSVKIFSAAGVGSSRHTNTKSVVPAYHHYSMATLFASITSF